MVLSRVGGRSRLAALAAAAVLVVTPVAVGCSDDGNDSGGTSPTPTQTQAQTDAPADPVAAKAEIAKNWTVFFNPNTSVDDRVAVLENGEQMRPVLAAFGSDPNAAKASAKVTAVSFTAVDKADVTYDLLVGGAPAVPNAKGTSVEQDGTWKVSVQTLCALVKQSGNAAVPGC